MSARVRVTEGVSRRYPDGTRRRRSTSVSLPAEWYLAGGVLRLCWLAFLGLWWVIFEVYALPVSLVIALARTAFRRWERFYMGWTPGRFPFSFWVLLVEWPPEPGPDEDPPARSAQDGDLRWL